MGATPSVHSDSKSRSVIWAHIIAGAVLAVLLLAVSVFCFLAINEVVPAGDVEEGQLGAGMLFSFLGALLFGFIAYRVYRANKVLSPEERRKMTKQWVDVGEMDGIPSPEHVQAMGDFMQASGRRAAAPAAPTPAPPGMDVWQQGAERIASLWLRNLPQDWRSSALFWAEVDGHRYSRLQVIDGTKNPRDLQVSDELSQAIADLRRASSRPGGAGSFIAAELVMNEPGVFEGRWNWDRRFWVSHPGAPWQPPADQQYPVVPDDGAWARELRRNPRGEAETPNWWRQIALPAR